MVDESAPEDAALDAAERWLDWIDHGEAGDSYRAAAAIFRAALTPERWEEALRAARQPLGWVVARTLRSRKYATELPGAPDGEYVVLEYDTEFERKKHGVETVVLVREDDGAWRVSGYWIR
ncbi:MAG TPA: DUF4019 domain-containing protein [Longimicrobiales bacterium]|nr:DUF4019 domain-containing protein [Longimicrobiales bacterium]